MGNHAREACTKDAIDLSVEALEESRHIAEGKLVAKDGGGEGHLILISSSLGVAPLIVVLSDFAISLPFHVGSQNQNNWVQDFCWAKNMVQKDDRCVVKCILCICIEDHPQFIAMKKNNLKKYTRSKKSFKPMMKEGITHQD